MERVGRVCILYSPLQGAGLGAYESYQNKTRPNHVQNVTLQVRTQCRVRTYQCYVNSLCTVGPGLAQKPFFCRAREVKPACETKWRGVQPPSTCVGCTAPTHQESSGFMQGASRSAMFDQTTRLDVSKARSGSASCGLVFVSGSGLARSQGFLGEKGQL